MKHVQVIKKFSHILFTSQPSQSSSPTGCKFKKGLMRVYLITERRPTRARRRSCFFGGGGLFWFSFFFCFSVFQHKVSDLYPGYLRVFFLSRVRRDASVSVDLLAKAKATSSEAAGHY